MGRQLSYYTYERASGAVEPVALADSTSFIVDTAPIGRWNTNIAGGGSCQVLGGSRGNKANGRDLWYGSMYYSVVQPSLTSF